MKITNKFSNKAMSFALYILTAILTLVFITLIVGLMLPKERIETRQSILNTPPETVYNTVTNNNDWHYRTGIKNLIILEKKGDFEVWDEITEDGNVIQFETKEKNPYYYYSFTMQSKVFTGYWTAEIKEEIGGKTLFIATEYIQVKNPFLKTLSYIFFDIDKLMEIYQTDLKAKVEQ